MTMILKNGKEQVLVNMWRIWKLHTLLCEFKWQLKTAWQFLKQNYQNDPAFPSGYKTKRLSNVHREDFVCKYSQQHYS